MNYYDNYEYIEKDNIKCRLIGYGRCFTEIITFPKDKYNEKNYNIYLNKLKENIKINKIVKIENGVEEVLLEKNK